MAKKAMDKLITRKEAASILGISVKTLDAARTDGLISYRNKKNPDDVLVRVLLNEKELRLPLPGDRAPYYRWEDFRDFYAGIVREARLKLEATK